MQGITYKNQILFIFATLIIVIAIFEFSNLDILIQNYFYNFSNKEWIINRDNKLLKFFFYDGIKILLIALLILIFLGLIFFRKNKLIQIYRNGFIIVLFSGILIPCSIGILKKITKTPCPKNISYYDGNHPYIKVFQKYPELFKKRVNCWPAGHASVGFSFLSLFFLFKKTRNKLLSFIAALIIGFIMGIYKMLIGDHFISHTIITMIISWLVILIVASITKKIFQNEKR